MELTTLSPLILKKNTNWALITILAFFCAFFYIQEYAEKQTSPGKKDEELCYITALQLDELEDIVAGLRGNIHPNRLWTQLKRDYKFRIKTEILCDKYNLIKERLDSLQLQMYESK